MQVTNKEKIIMINTAKCKNKILFIVSLMLVAIFALTALCACSDGDIVDADDDSNELLELYGDEIEEELSDSFKFFWYTANSTEGSDGYGLIPDRWPTNGTISSTASVGFGLAAYVVGVERGYITYDEGRDRVEGTLDTLIALQSQDSSAYEGFFYHFLDMTTGAKVDNCEVSTIDTALLLAGAVTAGEYFGDTAAAKVEELYYNINWKAFENVKNGKTYISMGYKDGVILSNWDWYAEQLIIYVLGAGSPNEQYRLDDTAYYDFTRQVGYYGDYSFYYSWFGSIFTYQYSHAFIDFRGYVDKDGTDWYDNSVQASEAAYLYIQDNLHVSSSYAVNSWGLTACDVRGGYSGELGVPPRGWSADSDYVDIIGTIAPAGAIGSVVFTPEQSLEALSYYLTLDGLSSRYGLLDSFNHDIGWVASDCIGIDKGITLLMLANYDGESVWNSFMTSEYVISGLEVLGFTKG